ncbi:MAG TPA: hypothetical protein VGS22_17015 [Thermoanaerobaculia bacterium]|jgi:hypothetical protein|nr:hypothetical protein [Thermoanaerobaculia bacterium]
MATPEARALRIDELVHHALVFAVKREARMNEDAIRGQVERLFALLAEWHADYLLVGGIALLSYVEGRNTEDIELLLAPETLARLPELEVTGRRADFASANFGGLEVDLLLTSNLFFDHVRHRHATVRPFAEREIPCATPEGLFLLKLYALPSLYRQGRLPRAALYEADLLALLVAFPLAKEALLEELAPFLPASDLAELTKLVGEIAERIEGHRFG